MKKVAACAARRTATSQTKQLLTFEAVEQLRSGLGKTDETIEAVKNQLKIHRDLLGFGFKVVVLSHREEVVLPGGNKKKKQWSGERLLNCYMAN